MKTRLLDDHQCHVFFSKGGDSFVSGSLSMPDHWYFESCVQLPSKQHVFDIHNTGLFFTGLNMKLYCPLLKCHFHEFFVCGFLCPIVSVHINVLLYVPFWGR